jgi:hypothetical protein
VKNLVLHYFLHQKTPPYYVFFFFVNKRLRSGKVVVNLGNISNRPKNYINVRVDTWAKRKLKEMTAVKGLNLSDHRLKYYSTFTQQRIISTEEVVVAISFQIRIFVQRQLR